MVLKVPSWTSSIHIAGSLGEIQRCRPRPDLLEGGWAKAKTKSVDPGICTHLQTVQKAHPAGSTDASLASTVSYGHCSLQGRLGNVAFSLGPFSWGTNTRRHTSPIIQASVSEEKGREGGWEVRWGEAAAFCVSSSSSLSRPLIANEPRRMVHHLHWQTGGCLSCGLSCRVNPFHP